MTSTKDIQSRVPTVCFALEKNESLPDAVKRIAVEQVELALGHLAIASSDLNESVHATRQSLKRLRALVALVRCELGGSVFEREWDCYRGAGRLLAGGRDAAVVVETFDALLRRFADEINPQVFAAERRFLEERRDDRLKLMVEEGAVQKATDLLVAARDRVADWPLKHARFRALREGLRLSYRSGRRGLRRVIHHPSPVNFHAWRRPVKLLWHQLQILTPIWPALLHVHGGELRNLSDRLNENHDLDALRQPALWAEFDIQPDERQAIVGLVERRCRVLEAEALPLGERLYAERPRRFSDRIECYWRAWERENRNAAVTHNNMANTVAAAVAQPI